MEVILLEIEKESEKMAEGQVISCHTVETWNEQLQKGKNDNKVVIIFSFSKLFSFSDLHDLFPLHSCV